MFRRDAAIRVQSKLKRTRRRRGPGDLAYVRFTSVHKEPLDGLSGEGEAPAMFVPVAHT